MNQKTLWFSLILLISAGLSIFFMVMRAQESSEVKPPGGVNAFMIKPSYREYDQHGALHSQLNATLMKHYVRHDSSTFIKPIVLIYTEDRIPWHITADYGKSQNGTKTILLYHHVVLHQPQKPAHPETTIHTSELTVYPVQSLALTDKKVKIQRPGAVIYGKGVRANFKTGIIKLLKKSRGIYESKQISNTP